jgi:hypothetical protein
MKSFAPAASQAQTQRLAGNRRFVEWAKTDVEQSIPARFEEQVIRHGARQAVCGERGVLTYEMSSTDWPTASPGPSWTDLTVQQTASPYSWITI